MSDSPSTKIPGTLEAERRTSKRQVVIGSVLISVDIGADNQFGLLVDLSHEGAAIQALSPMEVGSKNRLRWQFPADDTWIEVTGEIVWSKDTLYGIRFVDLDQSSFAGIRSWLQEFQKLLDSPKSPDTPNLDAEPEWPGMQLPPSEGVLPQCEFDALGSLPTAQVDAPQEAELFPKPTGVDWERILRQSQQRSNKQDEDGAQEHLPSEIATPQTLPPFPLPELGSAPLESAADIDSAQPGFSAAKAARLETTEPEPAPIKSPPTLNLPGPVRPGISRVQPETSESDVVPSAVPPDIPVEAATELTANQPAFKFAPHIDVLLRFASTFTNAAAFAVAVVVLVAVTAFWCFGPSRAQGPQTAGHLAAERSAVPVIPQDSTAADSEAKAARGGHQPANQRITPVEMIVAVDATGKPTQVRVVSGDPILASAASDAVLNWNCKPALINGRPVPSEVHVVVQWGTP